MSAKPLSNFVGFRPFKATRFELTDYGGGIAGVALDSIDSTDDE